jgi:hypothetical protein
MPDDRELDTLIDQALSTYVDAEPAPSLAARISAAVPTTRQRRSAWLLGLGPALACSLAALLAFVSLHHAPPRGASTPHVALTAPGHAVRTDTATAVPPFTPARQPASRRAKRSHTSAPPVPHLAVFPSPTPLTREEEALLTLANRVSVSPALSSPAMTQTADRDQPLTVPPISIAPIEIAALTKEQPTQPSN